MPIRSVEVNTTGVAGSATGNKTSDWELQPCVLDAIKVDYHASAPATTVLVVSEAGGLGRTLLTLTATATDGVFYLKHAVHDEAGAVVNGLKEPYVIEGKITVTVTLSNALVPVATVTLQVLEDSNVR